MKSVLIVTAFVLLTPRLEAGFTTAFQLGEQGGVIVPVMLNGKGPFAMLLDTGSTHSVITDSVVAATGARTVAQRSVISSADHAMRAIAAVERFSLGPHNVDRLLPSIVADGAFDAGGKIRGLVGQDVLASLRYSVDFKRRVIEWHENAVRERGYALTMSFEQGRFMIDLPQRGGTLRLVPDSGAGGLVLFNTTRWPNIIDTGHMVEVSTVNARRMARHVLLRELRLGDRTLRNVRAVALDLPDRLPAEGDGLLPLHLFERVTFDGPARVLILG